MNNRSTPTLEQDRIISLDMLRGFALLGIILANSLHFQFGLLYDTSITTPYANGGIDRLTESFIFIFVQASFYPLFSFLFGYGMALQKERLLDKGLNFNAVFWRRTAILGLVGYLHAMYLWNGDILFTYAWASVLLFFCLMMPARGLIITGLILVGLLGSCSLVPDSFYEFGMSDQEMNPTDEFSEKEVVVLSEGSYADVVEFRQTENPIFPGIFGDIVFIATQVIGVIGLILLGAYVMRKGWIKDPITHKKKWKIIMWVGLGVALLTKSPLTLAPDSIQLATLQSYVGGPFLTAFFVSAFVLAVTTERGKKILQPLAYAGRMAFTNYLFQSLIMTTIFYHYGFGLFNSVGVFAGAMIAVAVFIIQLILSKVWLSYFRMGPLEWIWRAGTYLQLPPLKKESK
ncbi:DUF418 domain-containing protein [Alkalicoccobacillus plakortidis]|uniref:DUF418 domain-containing protein n=1 Tax=Alkalicoccobacillus plakortidis TaxID=444060 RepID=A0ABT0XLV9_9BACI|nr:DUF418 domain-containing protein [Alkalicoccobacillus plakortidis]MCM2676710.1 DUF418 domain-containing protein [Alkalicoccobacillus plakortidis]